MEMEKREIFPVTIIGLMSLGSRWMHEKENLISFQTRVILGMRTGLRRSSIPHLKELLNKRVPTNTQSQAV